MSSTFAMIIYLIVSFSLLLSIHYSITIYYERKEKIALEKRRKDEKDDAEFSRFENYILDHDYWVNYTI